MPNRRPKLKLIAAPSASPAQAAAIVAALERFMRDTAPPPSPAATGMGPWLRTAMLEAVERDVQGWQPDPWINT